MISYKHILVPKSEIRVPKIVPKPYLKKPNARKILDQIGCWVGIINREKRVENLICKAAMVTKIVKKTPKIYIIFSQKMPFKDIKI